MVMIWILVRAFLITPVVFLIAAVILLAVALHAVLERQPQATSNSSRWGLPRETAAIFGRCVRSHQLCIRQYWGSANPGPIIPPAPQNPARHGWSRLASLRRGLVSAGRLQPLSTSIRKVLLAYRNCCRCWAVARSPPLWPLRASRIPATSPGCALPWRRSPPTSGDTRFFCQASALHYHRREWTPNLPQECAGSSCALHIIGLLYAGRFTGPCGSRGVSSASNLSLLLPGVLLWRW